MLKARGDIQSSLLMITQSAQKPLLLRLQLALARARFLSLSIFVHAIIVIVAGSAVVFQVQEPTPDFVAANGPIAAEEEVTASPMDTPTIQPQFPVETASPTPQLLIDAIATGSAVPTDFKISTGKTMNLDGKVTGSLSSVQGLGDKVAEAMARAGRAGGTMSRFGMVEKTPSALVGTFYDLKQTRGKKPTGILPDEYHKIFRRFVSENWRASILNDYFRAPQLLYASQIMIPNMSADEGPKAFGMEKQVQPSRWLVHYKGRVSPPVDGTYRFVGAGDDVMIVRFNGKVVLDRCWHQHDEEWKAEKNYDYGWTKIPNGFAQGDAIKVKAGNFYDIEVLIGEQPGGLVFACLLMEKEGEQYEKDSRGNPILPVFRVAAAEMPELQPGQTLPPHVANGPVWRAASTERVRSELDRFTSAR
ncbi:MAG: hypothetical protein EOP84_22500 [Verrucomicrobiaceae bacterium]|nr:MAG: hypothetical protein EOP84_22500 [Verrucomicrobiaceae bacterium]